MVRRRSGGIRYCFFIRRKPVKLAGNFRDMRFARHPDAGPDRPGGAGARLLCRPLPGHLTVTLPGTVQLLLWLGLLLLTVRPLGGYMHRVFAGEATPLSPLLRPIESAL